MLKLNNYMQVVKVDGEQMKEYLLKYLQVEVIWNYVLLQIIINKCQEEIF